jgi:hypothetical protein
MKRISQKKALEKINFIIEHNRKFSSTYFWTSPGSANERRNYEKRNSYMENFSFKKDGKVYEICANFEVSCSCKNVYTTKKYEVNGKLVDIRSIKKIGVLLA